MGGGAYKEIKVGGRMRHIAEMFVDNIGGTTYKRVNEELFEHLST